MKKDREGLRQLKEGSEFYPGSLLQVLFQLFISPFKPLFDKEM